MIQNYAFLDGDKRIGYAALGATLVLNAYEQNAAIEESEAVVMAIESGQMKRESLVLWVA